MINIKEKKMVPYQKIQETDDILQKLLQMQTVQMTWWIL